MNKLIIVVFSALVALTIAQPVCTGFQYAPEGAKCSAAVFPEIVNTTVACDPFLTCTASGLCTKPVSHGIECTHNDNCTSVAGLTGYTCIQNKCTYKRHFGQACSHNDECYSGDCDADKCTAKNLEESCTSNLDCKVDALTNTYLFCGSNNTCEAMSAEGEDCDSTKSNCKPGLHCVTNGGTSGTCKKRVGAGETCSAFGMSGEPDCQSGLECMWDTDKCEALQSRANGQDCQRGDHCVAGHACDIPQGQTVGTCKPEASVNCTKTIGENKCKSVGFRGYCKCTSNDEVGECASDLKDTNYCPTEYGALSTCLASKCDYVGRGSPAPFPADNCAASQCASEFKAYVCCAKANVVFPPDILAVDCTIPQPTTEPGTSPRDSSATGVIVSTIVVVASALATLM